MVQATLNFLCYFLNLLYTGFTTCIAECGGQVVGISVVEECIDPDIISDQFNIEQYLSLKIMKLKGCHVLLRHMIINPLFSHQAKWFMEVITKKFFQPDLNVFYKNVRRC